MRGTREYLTELESTLDRVSWYQIERIEDVLLQAHRDGKHIFTMGNGGSATTASHFACDLAKGVGMRTIALTDNISLLTAWANDTGYANIFVGQLGDLLVMGDVVIAISASGDSENVLRAVRYANTRAVITIGLTGFEGGKLKNAVKECLIVPSNSMERVEDVHLILAHLFCCYLREVLR